MGSPAARLISIIVQVQSSSRLRLRLGGVFYACSTATSALCIVTAATAASAPSVVSKKLVDRSLEAIGSNDAVLLLTLCVLSHQTNIHGITFAKQNRLFGEKAIEIVC
jgi:hypothetical protein